MKATFDLMVVKIKTFQTESGKKSNTTGPGIPIVVLIGCWSI